MQFVPLYFAASLVGFEKLNWKHLSVRKASVNSSILYQSGSERLRRYVHHKSWENITQADSKHDESTTQCQKILPLYCTSISISVSKK